MPVDKQIRLIGRTAQFPKISETIEVIQSEFAEIGLNVKIEMMDTANQLQYQLRPFPEDAGPYLLMIMHGNQAGDAAFTMDQYMLSDGPQAAYGTPEFDTKIAPPKHSPASSARTRSPSCSPRSPRRSCRWPTSRT